jgi:hypothetical protein
MGSKNARQNNAREHFFKFDKKVINAREQIRIIYFCLFLLSEYKFINKLIMIRLFINQLFIFIK